MEFSINFGMGAPRWMAYKGKSWEIPRKMEEDWGSPTITPAVPGASVTEGEVNGLQALSKWRQRQSFVVTSKAWGWGFQDVMGMLREKLTDVFWWISAGWCGFVLGPGSH